MSGYPPIPRDPSGAPLPVVWDDGLQSWKVYEGLMPLETKLAAIESKLLALDSKFADGSAKVALSGTIVELFRRTNIVLTAGSRMQLNPEPIDVSAFRGWQIGVHHTDQHIWGMRKIWYSGVYSHSATNSGFYEIDPIGFRSVSPVYPCLGNVMYWWMSSDGTIDTPPFQVRVWGVK